jgi:hypothetical protein
MTDFGQVSNFNNDFLIDIPIALNDYTLEVKVYSSDNPTTCNYVDLEDSATLVFTTPIVGTIFLNATETGNKNISLKLFPNPAKDILNIETSLKIEKINVYDASGKVVKILQNIGKSIDVSTLKTGVYHLEIFTDKGRFYEKVLIN